MQWMQRIKEIIKHQTYWDKYWIDGIINMAYDKWAEVRLTEPWWCLQFYWKDNDKKFKIHVKPLDEYNDDEIKQALELLEYLITI